ncbi:hypothetical protein L195_g009189 [Trifolium pratense]|uniref:Uncharacterized protein n=1 Tax=Trifolium pratense TaxID=57577 RepID=A0A2K3PBA3_TRIPR|nr:hypothetical protein L195_g009189 [Trifolium pratense]
MEEDLDFGKKVSINDTMEVIDPTKIVLLLRAFLEIQQRRAQAYSKLKSETHTQLRGSAFESGETARPNNIGISVAEAAILTATSAAIVCPILAKGSYCVSYIGQEQLYSVMLL